MSKLPFRRKMLAAAPLLCAAALVEAQQLEEVVVTAQFREQNVQDTPLAITAISGDTLEMRSQYSVEEIAAQAPNVNLVAGGAYAGNALVAFIRGVGQVDFIPALEPGIGIYVDDVYYSSITGGILELMDLERVEVLRGPQGTLAGKNSVGGAIKLYTKKPSGEQDGFAEIGYGNYDAIKVRGATNFTLIEDKLWGRISGVSNSRDGYVKNLDYGCTHPDSGVFPGNQGAGCVVDTEGGIDYTAGRLALRWMPSDDLDINLGFNFIDEDSEPAPNIPWRVSGTLAPVFDTAGVGVPFTLWDNRAGLPTSYGGQPYSGFGDPTGPGCLYIAYGPNSCDPNSPNDMYVNYATYSDPRTGIIIKNDRTLEAMDITLSVDWQISEDMSLDSITAYRSVESGWGQDQDGSWAPLSQLYQFVDQEQFSQEFRLNFKTGDFADTTAGVFYHETEAPVTGRINLNYVGMDFIHGPDPVDTTTWAVFANTTVFLTEQLELNAGIRYSDDEKDYTFRRHNPNGSEIDACVGPPGTPGNPPNCVIFGVSDQSSLFEDDRLDYRLALTYAFNDDMMGYVSWSTGYKGGGVNPRPFYSVQVVPVNPEELETLEVGMKMDLMDNRVRVNAAVFMNDYTDIQLQFLQCPQFGPQYQAPCLATLNAGDADVQGFELEIDAAITDNFSIDGSFSYLDFEWETVSANSDVDPNGITPYTPEVTWSIGAQYLFETAMGNIFARVDANYQDETWSESNNAASTYLEDRTLVNASLAFTTPDEKWRAKVEVKNLTEEEFFMHSQSGGSLGASYAMPNLPRTWMVSLRRDFF